MNRKEEKRIKNLKEGIHKILNKLYEKDNYLKGDNWQKTLDSLISLFEEEIKKERKIFNDQIKKEKDIGISRANILENEIKKGKINLSKINYQQQVDKINNRMVEKQLEFEKDKRKKVEKELESEKEKNKINGGFRGN